MSADTQNGAHRSLIERLSRRLVSMIGRGKVQLVDDSGKVQMIQIVLGQSETRDKAPRLAEYGFNSNPQPGADAIMIFAAGDRSNGVIVATGDQRYRIQLAPGEVVMHDDLGQKVHLTRTATVISGASNPVNIETSAAVNVNAGGNVVLTAGGTVQLGSAGGKKVVLDGDPVSTGGFVEASSTKVTAT